MPPLRQEGKFFGFLSRSIWQIALRVHLHQISPKNFVKSAHIGSQTYRLVPSYNSRKWHNCQTRAYFGRCLQSFTHVDVLFCSIPHIIQPWPCGALFFLSGNCMRSDGEVWMAFITVTEKKWRRVGAWKKQYPALFVSSRGWCPIELLVEAIFPALFEDTSFELYWSFEPSSLSVQGAPLQLTE